MSQALMAVVKHRRLMELKNSGAVKVIALKDRADVEFHKIRQEITNIRILEEKPTGLLRVLTRRSLERHLQENVRLMFDTRESLVEHIHSVKLPTRLVPLEYEKCKDLVFLDRAAKYAEEADRVLSLFKEHDEVMVTADTSSVITWMISNAPRIRNLLTGETQ